MTKPTDLTSDEFTRLYNELKRKIADETPVHNEPGSGPDGQVVPNTAGQQQDIATANGYLDTWHGYAVDGALELLTTVDGETPWATLHTMRNKLSTAKTELGSAQQSLGDNWTGGAATEYVNYLASAQRRFDDFVNGDDHCVDRARGLLREAFAVESGFKQGLHELATAASKAIDTFAEQHAEILLVGALGVGTIVAGAALSAATGGIAGAVLGTVASTLGGEAFSEAKSKWSIAGNEPVDIMRAMDAKVTALKSNYATAAASVVSKMNELVTDLNSYTNQRKLSPPPQVAPSGTSFTLKDFFPKDAAGDQQVADRVNGAK